MGPAALKLFSLSAARCYSKGSPKYEFLCGKNSVLAALLGKKRTLKRLTYLETLDKKSPESKSSNISKENIHQQIIEECRAQQIELVKESSSVTLDKLAQNKPHQNYILRASPILLDALDYLGPVNESHNSSSKWSYEAIGPGKYQRFPMERDKDRWPLWVILDEVVDPQNVGAAIRCCFFFGVDGILFDLRNSAPLNATVSRTSAGSLELMPNLFYLSSMSKFIKKSKENGWHIWGTDSSESGHANYKDIYDMNLSGPTLLILGNEGSGVSTSVLHMSDAVIGIPSSIQQIEHRSIVDSLNVSVATGVILSHLLETKNSFKIKSHFS